jgi:hypothetical protein
LNHKCRQSTRSHLVFLSTTSIHGVPSKSFDLDARSHARTNFAHVKLPQTKKLFSTHHPLLRLLWPGIAKNLLASAARASLSSCFLKRSRSQTQCFSSKCRSIG